MENRAANRYNSCELCESCDSCTLELLGFLKKRLVKSHRGPQWHARGLGFKSPYLHLFVNRDKPKVYESFPESSSIASAESGQGIGQA